MKIVVRISQKGGGGKGPRAAQLAVAAESHGRCWLLRQGPRGVSTPAKRLCCPGKEELP